MNREIEFRGKSIESGEWLYGSHFTDSGEDYIIPQNLLGIKDYEVYQADQNTIGQFTGLVDTNGVKVFEGDIVEVYDFTSAYASKYRGVVRMYRGSWCVEHEDFGTVFHPSLFFDDFADRKTKVIENIHDNPELLSTK